MKIEFTEEQAHTILIALIEKFERDVRNLVEEPNSKYYLDAVVNTRKAHDYIIKCMFKGENNND